MKKILSIMIVCMLIVGLVGCGNKQETSNGGSKEESQSSDNDKKIVIKFGHVESEDRSIHKSVEEFEKYVEQETDGKVDIQIFPNAQLGAERQSIEAVSLGTMQMTTASTGVMTMYDEKFSVLDLPFLFNSREAAYAAVDGALGDELNAIAENYGMTTLGYQDNGLRHISNSVRPINEPADLDGIKIRVMEVPLYIDLFKSLGANPTPMSFGEVYTALQQGTVDAQENGASLVYSSKFHEVQDYYSLTGHVYSLDIAVVNTDFFNGLPEDIQTIIMDGAEKCLAKGQREIEGASEQEFLDKLAADGMEINEITSENRVKFAEMVKPVYDTYEEKIGAEIIEKAKSFNK